ncbi:MAG: tryptophan--tRNA ligase [Gammaproteobacteria bacterium]
MHISKSRPTLFSGIQPSGSIHIGTYLGALKNWAELQDSYFAIFSIVDLHTITVRQDPNLLRERCYDVLALYIACGIDPKKSIIFCQSHVAEHAELAWILNCFTYMGELSRMTQFKDKSQKQGQNIGVGLFDYPVLMAADILLYGTKLVPIGADQKQHVELTRDLALRFNNLYGEIFTIPEVYIPKIGARVMGLQDPTKKMSKSGDNDNDLVNLLDDPALILKKMQRAVTDSGSEVIFREDKPGVSNLLSIYSAISNKPIATLEAEYQGSGYGKFKKDLAENLVAFLEPIQKKYHSLRSDQTLLNKTLQDGAIKAHEKAEHVLKKVKTAVGFITL